MIVWIVAAAVIALALAYGLIVGQYVLFWTIVLALIALSVIFTAMYCLNKEVDTPKS